MTTTSQSSAVAWVDGWLGPAADASMPLLDDGLLRGDGVFDAMAVVEGGLHAPGAHLNRLSNSARALAIDVDWDRVREGLAAVLSQWSGQTYVKVILTRSEKCVVLLGTAVWPNEFRLGAYDLDWRSPLTGIKTLSYAANQFATRLASASGYDDALIIAEGLVCELPTGSIVGITSNGLVSPDASSAPILQSVSVTELGQVEPVLFQPVTLEDVARWRAACIVSATRAAIPIRSISHDDVTIEFDTGGSVRSLRERYTKHVRETAVAIDQAWSMLNID